MRPTIPAFALLMLSMVEAHAGAWTLPRGDWHLFTVATTSRAYRTCDTAGWANIRTRYAMLLIQNCYEYGLTNALTVFAAPTYVAAEVETAATPVTRVQGSSLEAGARLALLANHGRLSLQISY